MKRIFFVPFYLFVAALILSVSCSSGDGSFSTKVDRDALLSSEADSLAYIIGLSVAEQLQSMDSSINVGVLCRAIMDYSEGVAIMDTDDARVAYLRYVYYVEPERKRGYEERYLADLAAADRNYIRTKTGLTYNIKVIGDEKSMPKFANDWVTIRYSVSRVDGKQVYPSEVDSLAVESFVLSHLPKGVGEALRLIGKGGEMDFWMASKLGYGDNGNEEMGIQPTETLHYSLKLTDLESGKGEERYQEQLDKEF